MAVNFGNTNTSRYYTVPDHADFTLPDGDWTWVAVVRPQAGANPSYLISTNAFGVADSFNVFISGGDGLASFGYNTSAGFSATVAPTVNQYCVLYVTRRSGIAYVGWKPAGGGAGDEYSGLAVSGTSNGTSLILGGRSDLDTARMFNGSVSWAAFIPGKGLTATEANDLATGSTILMSSPYAGSVRNLWWLQSSTPTTVTDSVNSRIATKVGAGYSANDTDPLPPISSVVKGITLQLYNGASNVGALTGIQAAFFDQAQPKDFLAPSFKTSTATTDASGNITVNVDSATSLSVGQNGFLVLYKLDGGDHRLSPALVTRVTIADIA